MAKILSMVYFLMKKTDVLSTIVWVSIPVRPKLPSKAHRLLQKVIILNCDGLWTLAIVRVKGREAELLISCNLMGGNQQPLNLQP